MLMHDPPHPGGVIRRQCLEPLGLTVTEAAKGLAVSRNTLSMLLNGRLGISPENSDAALGGVWGQPGKLAVPTDAVRPLAGEGEPRAGRHPQIRRMIRCLYGSQIRRGQDPRHI